MLMQLRAARLLALSTIVTLAACGSRKEEAATVPPNAATSSPSVAATPATAPVDTVPAKHHSKLAGAAIGAAAGHMLGGHAVAGAAVGAIVQHERNKH